MRRYPLLIASIILAAVLWLAWFGSGQAAVAPSPSLSGPGSFMAPPFRGVHAINAWFDHVYPNYGSDDSVVIYDGTSRRACASGENMWSAGCYYYQGHDGIDFAMSYEPVLAAADGTVISDRYWYREDCHSGTSCGFGMFVDIDHGNGYVTRYGHLSAVAVHEGQEVHRGQVIGSSGSTGNSTGPHLHFGVLRSSDSQPVDPFGWPDPPNDPGGAPSYWLWSRGHWSNGNHEWGGATPQFRTISPRLSSL